ncbi:hypothetical protein D3C81_1086090 [compost metagenome]
MTGTYAVVKDGKKIADAAIINGSAYAPVRAVAQAAGTALTVEGKTITMGNTVETSPTISGETAQVQPSATSAPAVTLTQDEKDILQRRITNAERAVASAREDIARAEAKLAESTDAVEIEKLKKTIKELETSISGAQKSIDADKARLAAAAE